MATDPLKRRKIPSPGTLTPQAKIVLDYLMARPDRKLTPLAAHTFLGIASITARIAELRKAFGEAVILDEWGSDAFKRRFKAYWMTVETIAEVQHKQRRAAE